MTVPSDVDAGQSRSLTAPDALLLALVVVHAATLWLPFANQEAAFNAAVHYFLSGDRAAVQAFFNADANTLVVPAIGATIARLFGISADWGARIVSLLSFAVLAMALRSIARLLEVNWIIVVVILLNPLIWVFAGRGTADFPPMAWAVAGIAVCWRARGPVGVMMGAGLFALGVLMKYHAVLLLPFIALAPAQTLRFRGVAFVAVGAVAAVALAVYNVLVFKTFGFWVTSPKWAASLAPTVQNTVTNFVQYGGFLALLALPFSAQAALSGTVNRWTVCGLVAAAILLGIFMPASTGEMNFGPFDRWIGTSFSTAVLAGLFAVFVISLYSHDRRWSLAMLLFILVLSFSRPAQRYLVFVLPFYLLFLAARIELRRIAHIAIVLFIAVNLFSAVAQLYVRTSSTGAFGAQRQW